MHELKAKDPNVFGPGGGSSRIFSLTELSFNVGLMLGPVVCGSISGAFGFYYTACTLGKWSPLESLQTYTDTDAIAVASAFVATTSFLFFTHKSTVRQPETE